MRAAIAILFGLIGVVLLGASFLNPPVSDALRPYVAGAGVLFLLAGFLIAAVRRRPRPSATIVQDHAPAPAAPIVTAAPAPPVAPPKAEVTLLAAGNAAAEPWARWYYVAAATTSSVAARGATVNVAVRGEYTAPPEWLWDGDRHSLDITPVGARVPVVIGCVSESAQPLLNGWTVPFKNWYLTSNGNKALGRFLAPFIAGFRHVFDVTVTWKEHGVEQRSSAAFELRFWRDAASEPRFIRLGDRPSYRDQIGGLREARERGTALRKEGMMLPAATFPAWLGRVDAWTSETKTLIAEVSTADSDYFWNLGSFTAPLFEGVRLHDDRHRRALQGLHERLIRLQNFVRA